MIIPYVKTAPIITLHKVVIGVFLLKSKKLLEIANNRLKRVENPREMLYYVNQEWMTMFKTKINIKIEPDVR